MRSQFPAGSMLLLTTVILTAASCLNKPGERGKGLAEKFFMQVEGTWKLENTDVYERWYRSHDGSIVAEVFSLDGMDTVPTERILLDPAGAEVFYRARVLDQNLGEPVSFRLVSRKPGIWVFENPLHDFPTRIEYRFTGTAGMTSVISGKENGNDRTVTFRYLKQ